MKKQYWWVNQKRKKSSIDLLKEWLNKKTYFYFHIGDNSYLVHKYSEYGIEGDSISIRSFKLISTTSTSGSYWPESDWCFSEDMEITNIRELTQEEYENYFI